METSAALGDLIDQDGELIASQSSHGAVAANAGDRIGGAQARFQPSGDTHQQLIADQMPQAVVDDFEPIQVEEEHGEDVIAIPLGAFNGLLQTIDKQDAIGQPGKRVGHGPGGNVGL